MIFLKKGERSHKNNCRIVNYNLDTLNNYKEFQE